MAEDANFFVGKIGNMDAMSTRVAFISRARGRINRKAEVAVRESVRKNVKPHLEEIAKL